MQNRLWASFFYFAYFSAGGLLFPFLPLFYEQNEMSRQQIGLLIALPTLKTVLAGPLWGSIADRFHLHRWLLPFVMIGVIVPVLLFTQANTFFLLAILILFYGLFNTPISPLADNAVLEMLGSQRDQYGKLRIWGAVGFGIAAWIGGVLTSRWDIHAIFFCYPVMMLLAALAATRLPAPKLVTAISPMIILSFACYGIRAFAYSAITDPAWVIPVQLLHGLTFAALWAAGVAYMRQIAPAGWGATAQALLGALFFGLAAAAGAVLGGVLYDRIGAVAMFRVAGVLALSGLALFVLTQQRNSNTDPL